MSQATMEDDDTAMDTHDLKLSIPETSADGARSGSPESGVSTPRYSEHQSGSKRLRTKDGWEEVEGGSDPDSGGPNRDDEPGTSVRLLNVTPAEVRQLTLRTKAACSELADVIVRLSRERYAHEAPTSFHHFEPRAFPLGRGRLKISSDLAPARVLPRGLRAALTPAHLLDARSAWTDSKELDTKRKRELCDQLRTIQRYATDTARAPFPKLSREKTRARVLVFSRDARAPTNLLRPRGASRPVVSRSPRFPRSGVSFHTRVTLRLTLLPPFRNRRRRRAQAPGPRRVGARARVSSRVRRVRDGAGAPRHERRGPAGRRARGHSGEGRDEPSVAEAAHGAERAEPPVPAVSAPARGLARAGRLFAPRVHDGLASA